jgi:GT2 family glycosyltransferase
MLTTNHSQKALPSVAIILVNWKSFDVTHDCLESLKQLSYPNYTVIVVDNGSQDESVIKLRTHHPDITVLTSETNLGFTGGNNIGLRYAIEQQFDYSILLNNDTFVEPDFLGILVTYMEEHPEAGAIQPRIHFHHNRNLLWNGGAYFNQWTGFTHTDGENKQAQQGHLQLKEVDWITGCAFLVRNNILQQTGLLAENLFMYSEDVDLSFRIRQLNYQLIYHPNSVIYHIAGVSNKSKTPGKEGYVNPMVHYYNQRNRLWLIKKYTPWYAWPTVIICNFFYILLVLGYFAVRGRFKKLNAMFSAIKDGISGRIAIQHH